MPGPTPTEVRHARFAISTILAMIAASTACERVPEHQRGTVPVSGSVTFSGAPVAGATVTFLPAKTGRAASAITDGSGHYKLTSFRPGDGAMPGDYQVIVMKYPQVAGGTTDKKKYVPPQGDIPAPKSELPERYSIPGKSGLKATVTTDAKANAFDFGLSR